MKLEQMGLNWVKMIFGENIDDLIVELSQNLFFFLINSSENFPPRPNAHEVSRHRAVTGKKEEKYNLQLP